MRLETLKLYNYENKLFTFQLQEKEIMVIVIEIHSGDEIATVVYADHSRDYFDSDIEQTREIGYNDGTYIFTTIEEYNEFNQRDCHYDRYLFNKSLEEESEED